MAQSRYRLQFTIPMTCFRKNERRKGQLNPWDLRSQAFFAHQAQIEAVKIAVALLGTLAILPST